MIINGGTLGNTSGQGVALGNVPQVWSSNIAFGGGNYLNLGTGAVTNTSTRTVTLSAGTLEVDGNITSPFPITTNGAGTMILGGVNTISTTAVNVMSLQSNLTNTGTTSISGGNLVVFANTTFTVASGQFTSSSSIAAIGNNTSSSPATMLVSGGTYSQPAGNLAIGQHSPGILSINGGLVTLANNMEFTIPGGNSPGTVNLNGGQLDLPGFTLGAQIPTANEQVNFNGGLLQLNALSANLFGANYAKFSVNVGNGGANIDLNGYSTAIVNGLAKTGSGGLAVYSSAPGGTLTLTGTNTYTGGTYVEGGTLIAANNEAIEDRTNVYVVGSAADLSLFGGVAPAARSPAGDAIAAPANAVAVPEPGTLALLLTVAAAAGAAVRRSRRSRQPCGRVNQPDLLTINVRMTNGAFFPCAAARRALKSHQGVLLVTDRCVSG